MNSTMEQILTELEDTALLLQKAHTNFKKCPKQKLTKGYIESRLHTIEEYWHKFTTAHHNLLRVVPKERKNDIPYFVNENYFAIEELYLNIQGDLRDLLSTLTLKATELKQDTQHVHSTSYKAQIKLPSIELPLFSSVYEDWPSFQDLFITLVHNNSRLSKVQKLHYLKSSVSGEAESLLKHIPVTNDSYDQAWDLLKGRYDNKRLIVNSLLNKLCSQKKIASQTATNIKSLLDTTNECLNGLKNLNVTTESWDPVIIFLVVQKLDPDSHREWEEQSYQGSLENLPSWASFVKFLEAKFRTLESLAPPSRERNCKKKKYTVHYASMASPALKTRSCTICQENHTLCHCKDFIKMEPPQRHQYLKTNQLCFNCLAPNHTERRCRLRMICRICGKRHHSLVHQHIPRRAYETTNQPDNLQVYHHTYKEGKQDSQSSDSIELSSPLTTDESKPLLATALVPVKDKTGCIRILPTLVNQELLSAFICKSRPAIKKEKKKVPLQYDHWGQAYRGCQASKKYYYQEGKSVQYQEVLRDN